jgi:hypothetical protein
VLFSGTFFLVLVRLTIIIIIMDDNSTNKSDPDIACSEKEEEYCNNLLAR